MNRSAVSFFTALLSVGIAGSAHAQGATASAGLPVAATLVAKYASTMGGPALLKAQSVTTRGSMVMSGMNATFEMVQLAPNKMKLITTLPGVGTIQVGFDGVTAWSIDPMQGPRVLSGKELVELQEQGDPRSAMRSPELFSAVQTVADTTMGGERCYLVKLNWKSGRETFDCFSPSSGLIVGSRAVQQTAMGAVPVVTLLSEYKKFGDVMFATKTVQQLMGQEQVINITAVEFNAGQAVTIVPPPEIQALKKPSGT
ncbi:MAG TPA: hypothetical protein VM939_06630 [Gemmatimonadaceae bacterium]|nr:hypothetical protein [Gemmatimonadaceae bacterium]